LNGRLYTGYTGVAGELGHTSIDFQGPRCACGNRGCVELYSSGPAIVRRVQQAYAGATNGIWAENGLTDLTFDQVILAAKDGDRVCIAALQDAARALAQSLVNVINLIDPEAIIIGYKLNEAGEICLDPIREVIHQQAIPQAAAHGAILTSELQSPVGVTGAACRALSGLLQNPALLLEHPVDGV
jgi:glucokinase